MTPARKGPDGEGSVYQRASDGLWVAAVTLPSGRRKVVYGKTEREAPKARRDLLRDVETGRPVPLGRTPKLGAYLARWLDRIASEVTAGHIRPRTGDSYRDLIERHVLSTFLADVKLNALSADDIRAWQRLRLTEKRQRTRKGTEARPLSPRTVGMAQAVLRRALNDAMRDELVARNVAALVRLPAGQSRSASPPSEAEVVKVVGVAVADRFGALWLTILGLGLRRGEVLALRWSRIDLDAGTVTIPTRNSGGAPNRSPATCAAATHTTPATCRPDNRPGRARPRAPNLVAGLPEAGVRGHALHGRLPARIPICLPA